MNRKLYRPPVPDVQFLNTFQLPETMRTLIPFNRKWTGIPHRTRCSNVLYLPFLRSSPTRILTFYLLVLLPCYIYRKHSELYITFKHFSYVNNITRSSLRKVPINMNYLMKLDNKAFNFNYKLINAII